MPIFQAAEHLAPERQPAKTEYPPTIPNPPKIGQPADPQGGVGRSPKNGIRIIIKETHDQVPRLARRLCDN